MIPRGRAVPIPEDSDFSVAGRRHDAVRDIGAMACWSDYTSRSLLTGLAIYIIIVTNYAVAIVKRIIIATCLNCRKGCCTLRWKRLRSATSLLSAIGTRRYNRAALRCEYSSDGAVTFDSCGVFNLYGVNSHQGRFCSLHLYGWYWIISR